MKRELLIGCGSSREKKIYLDGNNTWGNLTTLDYVKTHNPDVVWDLEEFPYPFEDNSFDEIHAYEVLEHTGKQGDWKFFFKQFSEFHRILKPGGFFVASVPMWNSAWAWGDPSHTRVIPKEQLTFLVQPEYTKQVGTKAMSDFRESYRADFDVVTFQEKEDTMIFVLTAVKPSRIAYV